MAKQEILNTGFWCLSNIFATQNFCEEFAHKDKAIEELVDLVFIVSNSVEDIV